MVVPACILAHANDEEGSVSSQLAIDDRRRGNSYLGSDLAAAAVVACGFSAGEDRGLPYLLAAIGVEGVDAVVFGGHIQDVAQLASGRHVGQIKRLGVDQAIHGIEADLAKLSGVYIAQRQNDLLRIEPIARNVVVIRGDIRRIGR